MADMGLNFGVNKLIHGDNLEILKTFPDEYIDLLCRKDQPQQTGFLVSTDESKTFLSGLME